MSATTLDLSRFPPPLAIQGVDYEAILAERKTRLVALCVAAGVPFNADVESDPAIKGQETDAYRELLALARVNDSVRAVMIAFAVDSDLDHIAAMYGVTRREIVAATVYDAAVMESNDELRRRALLAPEGMAACGPEGAFVFHGLTSDVGVLNIDAWTPAPGEVTIAVQARSGSGLASTELVESVRAYLHRPDIKPLTDVVTVQSVVNHLYSVDLIAYVRPGPDKDAVKVAIENAVAAAAAARRTPSRDVPRSALIGAAQLGMVDKVTLISPAADIARGRGEVGVMQSLNVEVVEYDG